MFSDFLDDRDRLDGTRSNNGRNTRSCACDRTWGNAIDGAVVETALSHSSKVLGIETSIGQSLLEGVILAGSLQLRISVPGNSSDETNSLPGDDSNPH